MSALLSALLSGATDDHTSTPHVDLPPDLLLRDPPVHRSPAIPSPGLPYKLTEPYKLKSGIFLSKLTKDPYIINLFLVDLLDHDSKNYWWICFEVKY